MGLLGYIAISGGLSSLTLGLAVWALRVRIGGLKSEVKLANLGRDSAHSALKISARDFSEYRLRAEAKKSMLVAELENYENQELDGIENEPDRRVRIRRRRSWVVRVLSQTRNSSHRDSENRMREDSSP